MVSEAEVPRLFIFITYFLEFSWMTAEVYNKQFPGKRFMLDWETMGRYELPPF